MVDVSQPLLQALDQYLAPVGTLVKVDDDGVDVEDEEEVREFLEGLKHLDESEFGSLLSQLQNQVQHGEPQQWSTIARVTREMFRTFPMGAVIGNQDLVLNVIETLQAAISGDRTGHTTKLELAFCVGYLYSVAFIANTIEKDPETTMKFVEPVVTFACNEDVALTYRLAVLVGLPLTAACDNLHACDEDMAEKFSALIRPTPYNESVSCLDSCLLTWVYSQFPAEEENEHTVVWNRLDRDLDRVLDDDGDSSIDARSKLHIEYCLCNIPSIHFGHGDSHDAGVQFCIKMVEAYSTSATVVISMFNAVALADLEDVSRDTLLSLARVAIGILRSPPEWAEDDEEITEEEWVDDDDLDLGFQGQSSVASALEMLDASSSVAPQELFEYIWDRIKMYCTRSENVFDKRVGFFCLSVFAENCQEFLEPYMDSVLAMCVQGFDHDSGFVRHAACNAVGQMSTDVLNFPSTYFESVSPHLFRLLQDPCPRVQSHACSCLVNMVQGISGDEVEGHVDRLFVALAKLAQNPPTVYVQESVVTAVAAVAITAKDFSPYYPTFIKPLLHVISSAHGEEYGKLRLRCYECAILTAHKVEAEDDLIALSNLVCDAPEFEAIRTNHVNDVTADFVHSILGLVAHTDGKYRREDLFEACMILLSSAPRLSLIPEPNNRLSIHCNIPDTTIMFSTLDASARSECAEAVLLLDMAEYRQDFAEALLGYISNPILALAGDMERAFEQFGLLVPDLDTDFLCHTVEVLANSADDEAQDLLAILAQELKKRPGVPPQVMQALYEIIHGGLAELATVFIFLMSREAGIDVEDEDNVPNITIPDDEVTGIARTVDKATLVLLTSGQEQFVKPTTDFIIQVLPLMGQLRDNPLYQSFLVCLYANLVESGSAEAVPFLRVAYAFMLSGLEDPCCELKQACAYTLGMLGKLVDVVDEEEINLREMAMNALPMLEELATEEIEDPDVDAELQWCKDNASSAYVKICAVFVEDIQQRLPTIMSFFPFRGDVEEGENVLKYLCGLLVAGNDAMLDKDILAKFATALSANLLDEDEFADQRYGRTLMKVHQALKAVEATAGCEEEIAEALKVIMETIDKGSSNGNANGGNGDEDEEDEDDSDWEDVE